MPNQAVRVMCLLLRPTMVSSEFQGTAARLKQCVAIGALRRQSPVMRFH
jgi:hypothetical protein